MTPPALQPTMSIVEPYRWASRCTELVETRGDVVGDADVEALPPPDRPVPEGPQEGPQTQRGDVTGDEAGQHEHRAGAPVRCGERGHRSTREGEHQLRDGHRLPPERLGLGRVGAGLDTRGRSRSSSMLTPSSIASVASVVAVAVDSGHPKVSPIRRRFRQSTSALLVRGPDALPTVVDARRSAAIVRSFTGRSRLAARPGTTSREDRRDTRSSAQVHRVANVPTRASCPEGGSHEWTYRSGLRSSSSMTRCRW